MLDGESCCATGRPSIDRAVDVRNRSLWLGHDDRGGTSQASGQSEGNTFRRRPHHPWHCQYFTMRLRLVAQGLTRDRSISTACTPTRTLSLASLRTRNPTYTRAGCTPVSPHMQQTEKRARLISTSSLPSILQMALAQQGQDGRHFDYRDRHGPSFLGRETGGQTRGSGLLAENFGVLRPCGRSTGLMRVCNRSWHSRVMTFPYQTDCVPGCP